MNPLDPKNRITDKIIFRIPIPVRAEAEAVAKRKGINLSKLLRNALDAYLHPERRRHGKT